MQRKLKNILILFILLLPMIHVFDNQILAVNSNDDSINEENIEITTLTDDFLAKIFIGDPFSSPYESFEFNPTDSILITGGIKNKAYSGLGSIKLSIWLVEAKTHTLVEFIKNFTPSSLSKGQSISFYELNGNSDLIWNIFNHEAGTYRFMAQVYIDDVLDSQTISGKAFTIRKLQLADFQITTNRFKITEYSFPSTLTSYGLTYYAGYLYMTNFSGNSILKIDTNTGSIIDTITLSGYSGNPYDLDTNGKHGWYIAYRFNDEIARFNLDGSYNSKINSPTSNPMGVCMLGSYLGVTHDSSNTMYKIYPFSGIVNDSWTVPGDYLYGLSVDYTNNKIWYADASNEVIRSIDYTNHSTIDVLDTGYLVSIAFDGYNLWAWNDTGKKLVKIELDYLTFKYNITNTGNCKIEGNFDIKIEKLDDSSGLSWDYYQDVEESTDQDGELVSISIGQSLIGTANCSKPNITGLYRLYIGILDTNGNLLYNLNNSVPIEHPTQGGKYVDSDKIPRIITDHEITYPTIFYTPEELNVTLKIKVIGVPPSEIGIFNISTGMLFNVSDISLEDVLDEDVITDPKSRWYSVNGGSQQLLPSSAVSGNKICFNKSWIPELSSLSVGEELTIKYNIEPNFTKEIKRPIAPGEDPTDRRNIGYRDDIILEHSRIYDSITTATFQSAIISGIAISPIHFVSNIGIVFYLGRMCDLYDPIDVLGLIIKLILWIDDLSTYYDGTIYFIDDDLGTDESLNFMGLTPAQKQQYRTAGTVSDQAHYLFTHVDHNLIAMAIEQLVTAEADDENWDYMMLIGGNGVIPMRILASPVQTHWLDYSTAEVATDFFYGDLTPEGDLGTDGYVQEVIVSRLPGRSIEDIATLLDAGSVDNTGEALLISYYKGEDSMRELADEWGAVKAGNTLFETDGDFTVGNMNAKLNPGNLGNYAGNPANFDYSFILYSDHGGVDSFEVDQIDLAGWDDYVDGARPFYFLRCCRSGYIGDPGLFKYGSSYTAADSIALDLLSKGIAGMVGSTRNSFSPNPSEVDAGAFVSTATQPTGAPASASGTYYTSTINFEGNNRDCCVVDPDVAGDYTLGCIDFNGDGDFGDTINEQSEQIDYLDFFESPSEPEGTFYWRYRLVGPQFTVQRNDPEDWNDIWVKYFVGQLGGDGIMQGRNVGTAFSNGKENYWAYMQTGVHGAGTAEEAYDYQLLYEYNLYGVPIYKPTILDPPFSKNYTVDFTTVNEWGFNATLGVENYNETTVGGKTLFEIGGAALTSGEGQPRLPIIIENITIPEGFTVPEDGIQVISNISTVLPGTYNISLSTNAEEDINIPIHQLEDNLSGVYPNKLYDFTSIKQSDGSIKLMIALFPFQWDSDTGDVTYYSNMTLHVDLDDEVEDSVSISVVKNLDTTEINTGSSIEIGLILENNGPNCVYNLQISESVDNQNQNTKKISILSTSGINSSCLIGYIITPPARFFSGSVSVSTTITYQDNAGTTYTMTIPSSIYITSWIGIIIIVVVLIAAVAIALVIIIKVAS